MFHDSCDVMENTRPEVEIRLKIKIMSVCQCHVQVRHLLVSSISPQNLVRHNGQNVRDMIRVWIPSYHQLQNKVYLTLRANEDLVSRTWGSPSQCTEWR